MKCPICNSSMQGGRRWATTYTIDVMCPKCGKRYRGEEFLTRERMERDSKLKTKGNKHDK